MRRLEGRERLEDFELTRLFDKHPERSTKATLEVNLGIVKIGFGDR
jgi:hypothetical protein